ncbi:MAG: hypothetical protein ACI39R_06220 [Lachnospiraceae bacterium]
MKALKRILCLFLVMVMLFTMTACGKDKKEETAGASAEEIENVKDIYDAVQLAESYKKGYYLVDIAYDVNTGRTAEEGELTLNGKTDGKNVNVGFSISVEDIYLSATNLFSVVDDKAYFSLDSFWKCMVDVETSFGSLPFPMPEIDEKAQADMQAQFKELCYGLLKAAFSGVEAVKEGDTYVIELKTAEEYTAVAKAVVDYLIENQDEINACFNSGSLFDLKEYLVDVVEYYREDLKKSGQIMGSEVSDDVIDFYIETIRNMELQKSENIDIMEQYDLEALKAEIEATDLEEFQADIDANNLACRLSVKATTDFYSIELCYSADGEEVGSLNVTAKYEFRVDADAEVKAPLKETTLAEMTEILKEDKELFNKIYSGLAEKITELNGYR